MSGTDPKKVSKICPDERFKMYYTKVSETAIRRYYNACSNKEGKLVQ